MNNIPTVQSFISDVVNKYVIGSSATNQGINGFVFDVLAQEEVVVEAEATDHYVEANYAIQDHIALRPVTFTLKGFIGELKNTAVNSTLGILSNIQSLGDIGGLAPNFAQQASQVYSKIQGVVSTVDSYINQANNLASIFNNASTSPDAQQNAFNQLSGYCQNRILCTVSTPFGTFKNMMITRISSMQREDTKIISEFTVALKEIRTVDTITLTQKTFSGRAAEALNGIVQKGQVVGKPVVNVTVFDKNWNKVS